MRRLLPIVVLALACDKGSTADRASTAPESSGSPPPAEAAPAERVSFGEQIPAVGMKRDKEQAFVMEVNMRIEVAGQVLTAPFVSATLEIKHEEVAALEGNDVSKLLVIYEAMETKKIDDKGEQVEASPLVGKSYVVSRAGDKITAARKDKKKTPKAERDEVEKDYARLGEPDKICARLRESPPAIGDVVELSGADFPSMADGGSGSVTLTLKEVVDHGGRPTARFDMRMQMNGPMDDGELTLDVSGTLLMDVQTCAAGSIEAEGPMTITASGKTKDGTPLKMHGEGRARFKAAETPWQPAAG